MTDTKMKYLFPLGLFIALFLDGSLSLHLAQFLFAPNVFMESRLLLLWLIMAVCYSDARNIFLWSVIVGFFFDSYYTGVLGLFTVMLPLMVYLTREIMNYFTVSFIVVLLVYLIDVTVLTGLFYWANILIGFTTVSIADFIGQVLGPTLAYNLAWYVVLFFPLKRFFEKFA